MREIKFRAWDKERKKMFFPHGLIFVLGIASKENKYSEIDVNPASKDYVVMQYTGLKDKNGKDIYEGDVVNVYRADEYPDEEDYEEEGLDCDECRKEAFLCKQKVKWGSEGGYWCEEDTGDFCPPLGAEELVIEVIGNIYENQELLEMESNG